MSYKEVIPSRESVMRDQAYVVLQACREHGTAWGLNAESVSSLAQYFDDFDTVYHACKVPETATKPMFAIKRGKGSLLRKELYAFYQNALVPNSAAIGEEGWAKLQLSAPQVKKRSADVPDPVAPVHLTLEQTGRQQIVGKIKVANSLKRKPDNSVRMTLVRWFVADESVVNRKRDFCDVHATKKSTFILSFPEEHCGKIAWFSACFMNRNGRMGPWSEPVCALIR